MLLLQRSLISTVSNCEPTCDSNNSSQRNSVLCEGEDAPDGMAGDTQETQGDTVETLGDTSTQITTGENNTVNISINNQNHLHLLSQQNNNANPDKTNSEDGGE